MHTNGTPLSKSIRQTRKRKLRKTPPTMRRKIKKPTILHLDRMLVPSTLLKLTTMEAAAQTREVAVQVLSSRETVPDPLARILRQ